MPPSVAPHVTVGTRTRRKLLEVWLTFEEAHSTIEALGAQLIVSKRSEELADEDVHLFRNIKRPHVSEQQLDIIPPFRVFAFL